MAGVVGENVKFADCGGRAADTCTVLDDVDEWPRSLVTVSTTVNIAARVYWCVAVTPVPVCPSPKSHANVPLLTLDDEALKMMSWLMAGLTGEKVKRATVATTLGKSSRSKVT